MTQINLNKSFHGLLAAMLVTILISGCGHGNRSGDNDYESGETGSGDNGGSTGAGGSTSSVPPGQYRVLAANDLGMHCADRDYQIFSILPPFNVVHAQVVKTGRTPSLLSKRDVNVEYSATSSANDPAGANSINTTSSNRQGLFKSNFWEKRGNNTLGGLAYGALYPPGVFDNFEPLPTDMGIPVPDAAQLPALAAGQQAMPGFKNPFSDNVAQRFGRFDTDLHFFAAFPFGKVIQGVNWFAADGIPLTPVDDSGRDNPYALMKVAARDNAGQSLASTDVVLPTASEADCKNCHADPDDAGNGIASTFAGTTFAVLKAKDAPGPEKVNNAAKINILRLHDAKHGAQYISSIDGSPAVCDPIADPNDPDCLANQTPVQCSQCHYSPALDLAQTGPVDDHDQGIKGRQQTRHISMSRAMHAFHGRQKDLNGQLLFPEMPAANAAQRNQGTGVNDFEKSVLNATCYQCHPGRKTQCLRGAMFAGGVVCQDCHGNMADVGNDFSANLASGGSLDLNLRVPWASEPKCQSCHTGDASQTNHPSGAIVAPDGIRLLQAYLRGADGKVEPISSPSSRFAENQSLYRLSGNDDGSGKGHHGVMCEGCHGSPHAIWPNPNPNANDNIAARQLQGHAGPVIECDSCHEPGSLGITLGGPHGMHPVGGTRFANGGHAQLAERNRNSCRACHGNHGEGTVLSRVAADRSFRIGECENGSLCPGTERGNFLVNLQKGSQVSCNLCHRNQL